MIRWWGAGLIQIVLYLSLIHIWETVGYEYDKYGRVTGKSYNGGTQFTWKYDNLGNQQEHMDRANGVKYVYQYDLIDRLTGVDADNGQQQRFVYDTKNRLESYLNKVEGETVKTKFVYGNPEELSLIHI